MNYLKKISVLCFIFVFNHNVHAHGIGWTDCDDFPKLQPIEILFCGFEFALSTNAWEEAETKRKLKKIGVHKNTEKHHVVYTLKKEKLKFSIQYEADFYLMNANATCQRSNGRLARMDEIEALSRGMRIDSFILGATIFIDRKDTLKPETYLTGWVQGIEGKDIFLFDLEKRVVTYHKSEDLFKRLASSPNNENRLNFTERNVLHSICVL